MSKLTGLSTPFKLSFKPELFSRNNGAETLVKFKVSASLVSKKSLTFFIAISVLLMIS